MKTDLQRYTEKLELFADSLNDQGHDPELCFAIYAVLAELEKK